jgi:hypothetical protein
MEQEDETKDIDEALEKELQDQFDTEPSEFAEENLEECDDDLT